MPSIKTESGTSNIECKAFPVFSSDKNLLKDKTCHIIKPYDDGELFSVFVVKKDDGFILKILDKNGKHVSPDSAGPIDQPLRIALNIGLYLKLRQYQLFFSIKNKKATLVDVFNGKSFISPGMLSDIYNKRIKIQHTASIEKYDPKKDYGGAIIKPAIVCCDNNSNPIYLKTQ